MRKTILLYETRAPGCNFIHRIHLNGTVESVDESADVKIHVESTTVRSKVGPSECVPHRNQ